MHTRLDELRLTRGLENIYMRAQGIVELLRKMRVAQEPYHGERKDSFKVNQDRADGSDYKEVSLIKEKRPKTILLY